MFAKNRPVTHLRPKNTMASTIAKRHCLVHFPLEGSHGIWPEHLIRSKGRFGFEAKHGAQWFERRIEKEGMSLSLVSIFITSLDGRILGTLDECETVQKNLEKALAGNEEQWSSAETELSESDDDTSDSEKVKPIQNSCLSVNFIQRTVGERRLRS
jgi:hypothetical protein